MDARLLDVTGLCSIPPSPFCQVCAGVVFAAEGEFDNVAILDVASLPADDRGQPLAEDFTLPSGFLCDEALGVQILTAEDAPRPTADALALVRVATFHVRYPTFYEGIWPVLTRLLVSRGYHVAASARMYADLLRW